MELSSLTLYLLVACVSFLVYFIKNQYEFWKRRDIPYDEPKFLYGSLKGLRETVGIYEIFTNMYNKFKGTGPFAGFFTFTTPSVILLDLDLIKNVLIKDFNNFNERGLFYNERDEPLTAHLFALDGPKWKALRGKLSSTFTSGKMKYMFPTMVNVGDELVKVLDCDIKTNPDIEVRELLARFTTDVIGTCAFGIDCNSLKDADAEFRQIGKSAFSSEPTIAAMFSEAFPKLFRLLRLKRIPHKISSFIIRIVEETVTFREKNNVKRNDFIDILIDLKNKKSIQMENSDQLTALTMNEIFAQAFVFFLAGFETSSTAMGFALYELAQHQDIQDKLRKEINEVVAKYDGNLTYEGTKDMIYMDQVISETLRKFAPAANVRRKAKEEYPTDNPKYVIPKGAFVIIPVLGIHHDPNIYADPEIFDPERFTHEKILKRHPMAWLPFGDGPRNCIGLRFGMMQTRVGLGLLIKNFKFSVTEKTPIPMKFSKKSLVVTSEKGIFLKVERIV